MKISTFDIEIAGGTFSAMYSRMTVGSIKEILPNKKGKITTFRADDPKYFNPEKPGDDSLLVKAFIEELAKSQLLVGWYSTMFDLPWLMSKAAKYDIKRLPPHWHIDLCFVMRANFKMSSKLENAALHFGLDEQKIHPSPDDWIGSGAYDKAALDRVTKRNISDVKATEEAYWKLLDFGAIKTIARRN